MKENTMIWIMIYINLALTSGLHYREALRLGVSDYFYLFGSAFFACFAVSTLVWEAYKALSARKI